MEGPFTKQVARWCSNDLQQSLSSSFSKMAMLIDEKLKKDHDDIKKQQEAIRMQKNDLAAREEKFARYEADRMKSIEEKEVDVVKQEENVKSKERKLNELKKKFEEKEVDVVKQEENVKSKERKLNELKKKFEEKEVDVVKQEENVKSKERKLNELKKKFNETKQLFEEARMEAEKAIRDDKEEICRQKAELEEREHDVHFMEVALTKKEEMEKKQDSDRRPSEWMTLEKYGNDPKLLGDNYGEFDRLKKVCKMMERNNAVVHIRTDYLTEVSVGILPSSAREVSRITSARGENDKQCLKDLGDELLKRVRTTYSGSGRTPSVQSYQFRA